MKKVILIGDSMTGATLEKTKGKYASWGAYIHELFNDDIIFENRTMIGWAIADFFHRGAFLKIGIPHWEAITLKGKVDPNIDTVVFCCFGTLEKAPLNHPNPAYSGPRGSIFGTGKEVKTIEDAKFGTLQRYSYGEYLRKVFDICKSYGVSLYFLTPPVRDIWENGKLKRGFSIKYINWMHEIAKEKGARVLDINAIMGAHLEKIGPKESYNLYAASNREDGKDDRQHTSETGAREVAKLVKNELCSVWPNEWQQYIK